MAKSSKSKTGKSTSSKPATDEVDVTANPTDAAELSTDVTPELTPDSVSMDGGTTGIPDDETIIPDDEEIVIPDNEDGLDLGETTAHPDLDIEIVEDPIEPEVSGVPYDAPAAAPAANNSGGLFSMLLGGVAVGAIGYGIATFFPFNGNADDLAAQIAEQSDQIAALQAQLADVPTDDLSGLEQQFADEVASSSARVTDLSATVETGLSALDARLVEVEKRPGADGTLSEVALAAYRRELEDLRAELAAQQEGVMSAAAQAEADLAAARAEAESLEQQALAAAAAASARAALNRIATAVETGAPFEDALSGLSGDVPPALTDAAATGVATSAELASSFPAVARAALASARSEGESDDAGGIGGFFRSQFDVRSTAPREGSDPDAVLSRAEAAMKEGRVSDALAEIEALPEVARAEMTDWTAQATERADVLAAIATLSATYN